MFNPFRTKPILEQYKPEPVMNFISKEANSIAKTVASNLSQFDQTVFKSNMEYLERIIKSAAREGKFEICMCIHPTYVEKVIGSIDKNYSTDVCKVSSTEHILTVKWK